MKRTMQLLGCLAILALPVTAHAKMTTAPDGDGNSMWQAQHQEMAQLREQRIDLQGERDRIKIQCMNVKGQDRTACEKRMSDLRAQEASLHQNMQNVSDHGEAMREEHKSKKWEAHKASMKKEKSATGHSKKGKKKHAAPAPAPADDSGMSAE